MLFRVNHRIVYGALKQRRGGSLSSMETRCRVDREITLHGKLTSPEREREREREGVCGWYL